VIHVKKARFWARASSASSPESTAIPDDHAREARRDEGGRARRRPPLMRARLQGDVEGRPARPVAGGSESLDLGVRPTGPRVKALSHHHRVADHDRADQRIR